MIELLKEELNILEPFNTKKKDVDFQACINGLMGNAYVNDKNNPTTVALVVADFFHLIGDLNEKDEESVINLLSEKGKEKIICIENPIWQEFLEKHFRDTLKKFKRYAIKWEPHAFDKEKLYEFVRRVEPEFTVRRIDEELYHKCLEQWWTADFCSNFQSLEDFLEHGVGYVIMENNEIIAGASSYTYCEGAIDISIETLKEYRRKGLALACASKVILECLDREIYPKWDAGNMASVSLAEKLGYSFDKEYFVYTI